MCTSSAGYEHNSFQGFVAGRAWSFGDEPLRLLFSQIGGDGMGLSCPTLSSSFQDSLNACDLLHPHRESVLCFWALQLTLLQYKAHWLSGNYP